MGHRSPQGISIDLNQFLVVSTFERCMAAAGSTSLGHTTLHSPTKVQSQMPSWLPITARCSLP